MGLDIYCNGKMERVGSYSYVHINRINWIKATISFLKEEILKNQKLIMRLERCIREKNKDIDHSEDEDEDEDEDDVDIIYNEFEGLFEELNESNLAGVYYWVYHSDCEGILSSSNAKDIIISLEKIYKYFSSDDFDDNDNSSFEKYYLYPIFKESIDSNKDIEFC